MHVDTIVYSEKGIAAKSKSIFLNVVAGAHNRGAAMLFNSGSLRIPRRGGTANPTP
jgi:hypothetical protein